MIAQGTSVGTWGDRGYMYPPRKVMEGTSNVTVPPIKICQIWISPQVPHVKFEYENLNKVRRESNFEENSAIRLQPKYV